MGNPKMMTILPEIKFSCRKSVFFEFYSIPTQRSSRQRNGPWNAKSSVFDSSTKSSPTRFETDDVQGRSPGCTGMQAPVVRAHCETTTAGPREQPSGGHTISNDLLEDHHTDGDEKWNKPLVQTGTTLPEIEKNTEGG
jgi:hypothetical protein